MHSARIATVPPNNAADIDVASAAFGLNDRVELQLSPPLSWGEEMQQAVDDHRFLAAKISFRLVDSRILCASRVRVRYPDFGHNYGVIRSGSAGVF